MLSIKSVEIRKVHRKGYAARFALLEAETKPTKEEALAALETELAVRTKWDNLQPTIETYHGITAVVWYNGYSYSYQLSPGRSHVAGISSRSLALDAARNHVAQMLMDTGIGRELARNVAVDKALFDTLFPVAA